MVAEASPGWVAPFWRILLIALGASTAIGSCIVACEHVLSPEGLAKSKGMTKAEVSGCRAFLRGGICELESSRELRFWLPETAANLKGSWRSESGTSNALTLKTTPILNGSRVRINVPAGAHTVLLKAARKQAFAVQVQDDRSVPELLDAGKRRHQPGEAKLARSIVERARRKLQGRSLREADSLLARITLSEGKPQEAALQLEQTMVAAKDEGLLSQAVRDAFALGYIQTTRLKNFNAARNALEFAKDHSKTFADGRAQLFYYEGLLFRETGQYGSALRSLQRAGTEAERLGLESLLRDVELARSAVYLRIGRFEEAFSIRKHLVDDDRKETPCERLDRYTALAWLVLMASPDGTAKMGSAQGFLKEARSVVDADTGCQEPFRVYNHLLNELLMAVRQSNLIAAKKAQLELGRVDGVPSRMFQVWRPLLDGQVFLLEGKRNEAIRALQQASELAYASGNEELRARVLVQLGLVLEGADPGAAERSLLEAREALLRSEHQVPFAEGKARYAEIAALPERLLVALYVRSGRMQQALDLARRSLARAQLPLGDTLGSQYSPARQQAWFAAVSGLRWARLRMEQHLKSMWKLPLRQRESAKQHTAWLRAEVQRWLHIVDGLMERPEGELTLTAPEAGEAYVVFYPGAPVAIPPATSGLSPQASGVDKWFVFVSTAELTQVAEFEVDERSKMSGVPESLWPLLGQARHLRVFLPSKLDQLDVHQLEVAGKARLVSHSISYGFDLRRAAVNESTRALTTEEVLVVGDPTGDLLAAEQEARLVHKQLKLSGNQLIMGKQATREAVLAQLERVDWLHYAGHGTFGGVDSASSSLKLTDGNLTLWDVATLPEVPRVVLLSACDTARRSRSGHGVAHAFLSAGSAVVVAANGTLNDAQARRLMSEFYRDLDVGASSRELAEKLREVQLTLHRQNAGKPWADFRLFER